MLKARLQRYPDDGSRSSWQMSLHENFGEGQDANLKHQLDWGLNAISYFVHNELT
jgi:hypothetical protein